MPAMKVSPEQFASHMTPIDVPQRKSFGDWVAIFIFLVLTPGIVAVFLLGMALFSTPLLLVVGYTDSTGDYEFNQELSEKRAARVVNFLQQECKWAPYRMMTPTGMAEADPAADNTTEAGKAQNRRVAVNILVSKSVDGMGSGF